MLQIDFLAAILQRCKNSGIHTAVDTAGDVPWDYFEKILPYTDLFLYDIKTMDCAMHKKYTGVGNTRILHNLSRLLRMKKAVWVRMPIIPGVNDTTQEMNAVKAFYQKYGHPEKTELLPYHKVGEHKYEMLGQTGPAFCVPTTERMEELQRILSSDAP